MDATKLETRVKHISDRGLIAALNPAIDGLEAVRGAARDPDPMAPWTAWRAYLLAHRDRRSVPPPEDLADYAAVRDVIREADLVVRRDIACWGGVRIRYRGEVDFSRNPRGASNYGFHYFGWITPLARAWRETGDEKYARAFVDIFRQWYRQRDLVKGDIAAHDVIWYELGTGSRMPVLTSLYFATLESEAARDPAYHRDMLKTALGHGRWLHGHETSYRAGNWQVHGARGLLLTGLAFPEFRESTGWVRRGLGTTLAHAERDVYADGCHKERAPHYHLVVARQMVSSLQLVDAVKGIAGERRRLRDVGRRMLRWTATILTPTRHSPAVGDSEYDVPAAQFRHDGAVLRDPILVTAAGGAAALPRCALLEDSGFVVIRSGWRTDDLWFLLNYGPWGGGHSHAEALAFQLWAGGVPLAGDCGRGVSYDDPLHRTWYITPYAHNMVVVDGKEPSVSGRRGRLLFNVQDSGAHLLGLEHGGYREIGVRHRRCFVVSERRRYLVVLDFLRAHGSHRYEWVLNTPVAGLRAGRGRACGKGLTVLAADADAIGRPATRRVRMCLPMEGGSTWGLPRGWGTNVRFASTGGSVSLAFLLMPTATAEGVRFNAEPLDDARGYRLRLTVTTPRYTDRWLVDCAEGTLRKA